MDFVSSQPGLYVNLYTALGITEGSSLVITNQGQFKVTIVQGLTQPSSGGYVLTPGNTCIVHGHNNQGIWVLGSSYLYVQSLVQTIMPFSTVDLPHYLYTSEKERYRRLRVDVAQTGFFEGREFRTFYEFNVPAGTSQYIRVIAATDVIVHSLSLSVDEGSLRLSTIAGATTSGTYSTPLPVIPKNNMAERPTPVFSSSTELSTGGSLTGGTVIDVVRAVNAKKDSSIGLDAGSERGIAAGTYFFKLENFGLTVSTGVLSAWWEERPMPNF